jgi:hypothetical protein
MIPQTRQIGFVRLRTYVVLVASMAASPISGLGEQAVVAIAHGLNSVFQVHHSHLLACGIYPYHPQHACPIDNFRSGWWSFQFNYLLLCLSR